MLINNIVKTILLFLCTFIFLTVSYTQEISLSHRGGYYSGPFDLRIGCRDCDEIYYTVNGKEPDSLSDKYLKPLRICNELVSGNKTACIPTTAIPNKNFEEKYFSWQEPVKYPKAVIISIRTYKNGVPAGDIVHETFFIDAPDFKLPVISIITDPNGLFDEDTGIYVPGKRCDKNNSIWTGNYHMRGLSWEKKAFLQLFVNDSLVLEQKTGIRIHGAKTRSAPQKSLRIYSKETYGDNDINYPLFKNNRLVKTFILQTPFSSHRSNLISDVVAQEMSCPLNLETVDYNPCVVFINGEYWGLHFIRERTDNNYINSHFGINPDSVLIHDNAREEFNKTVEYIEKLNVTNDEDYGNIRKRIDIPCFIDYVISETYFRNLDWLGNNEGYWKSSDNGMWRFVLFDLDAGYQRYNKDMFAYIEENKDSPVSRLFRVLIKNSEFKRDFINRYAYIVNNCFTPRRSFEVINTISKSIDSEIRRQKNRWGIPLSKYRWRKSVGDMKKFANLRAGYVDIHLKKYLGVEHTNIITTGRKVYFNINHIIIIFTVLSVISFMLIVLYLLRHKKLKSP